VLGDGPDFSDVFLPIGRRQFVDDPAAKAREALARSDHKRANDERKTAGPFDAEVHDVIQEAADVVGLLLDDVFPASVGWGFQIHVVRGEAGVFIVGECHGPEEPNGGIENPLLPYRGRNGPRGEICHIQDARGGLKPTCHR
jgi:hypothetical protein